MYCILVTGMPASGKSTIAKGLGEKLGLPVISKDDIKEMLFDDIGFRSRAEKVRLGDAAMHLMYDFAGRVMERGQSVIIENNFENASRAGLDMLLEKYGCRAITVLLTGDMRAIYERFLARNASPDRHRGHVVNDCYPEEEPGRTAPAPEFEGFAAGIRSRGMADFAAGYCIRVDTTDFSGVDVQSIARQIREVMEGGRG